MIEHLEISDDSTTVIAVVGDDEVFPKKHKVQSYNLSTGTLISEIEVSEEFRNIQISKTQMQFLTVQNEVDPKEYVPTSHFQLRAIKSNEILRNFNVPARMDGQPNPISNVGFLGEQKVWSFHKDGTLYFWDVDQEKIDSSIPLSKTFVWSLSFSPDGKKLGYLDNFRSEYHIIDISTQKDLVLPYQLKYSPWQNSWPWVSGYFSQDGSKFALVVTPDNIMGHLRTDRVLLWDLNVKKLLWEVPWPQTISREQPPEDIFSLPYDQLPHEVTSLAFLPDGQRLAVTATASQVAFYDAKTGTYLSSPSLGGTNSWLEHQISVSGDSKRATGKIFADLTPIWNIETGEPVIFLSAESENTTYFFFPTEVLISPDGNRAVGFSCQAAYSESLEKVVNDRPIPCGLRMWDLSQI